MFVATKTLGAVTASSQAELSLCQPATVSAVCVGLLWLQWGAGRPGGQAGELEIHAASLYQQP